jgi:uncharacterized protein YegJ (DUF2314 family)
MASKVLFASASDPELAEASARARATFGFFWRELSWEARRIVPAFDAAFVKVAFEERGTVEHMWVAEVGFDGESLHGTLINEPNELANVHEGDEVSATFGPRIGDWMLTQGGKVLGAFTVNAMRATLSDKERRKHDKAWGLDFGNPSKIKLPPSDDDHPMALNTGPSFEEFLSSHPDELRQSDDAGFTLLHREALAGNAILVAALLARGANVNARAKAGKTALTLARVLAWRKVESLLVGAGGTE